MRGGGWRWGWVAFIAILVTGYVRPAAAQLFLSPPDCCTGNALNLSVSANPAEVILINQVASGTGTLNVTINPGSASSAGPLFTIGILGEGLQDTTSTSSQGAWATGPTIQVNNGATLSLASSPLPSAALLAESIGANGYFQEANHTPANSSVYNGAPAGPVTVTTSGSFTINATAPSGTGAPWLPFAAAINGYSAGGNGVGGKTNDNDIAGNGGNGGAITMTTGAGTQITLQGAGTNGLPLNGINAYSQGGGPGCDCSGDVGNLHGASGTGGTITVTHNGSISSSAVNSIGISAVSIGGDGGLNTGHGIGSDPGTSGSGGNVSVTLNSGASINLTAGNGIGVLAASSVGPSANSNVNEGTAGGTVQVTINSGASISSAGGGAFNIGVAAVSTGSPDILQPFNPNTVNANGSGYSGPVTVTNNGSISTNGQLAIGIAALSLGGSGIFTTSTPSAPVFLGNSGPSTLNQTGGAINIANTGTIVTNGGSAFGILAASNGAGGLVNLAATPPGELSTNVIGGQEASNNGSGGNVSVTNSGTITTGDGGGGGKLAIGILAQSIGGGGGSSGGSGIAFLVGDAGGTGGNGGPVSVTTNGGLITTKDDGAIGVLAQSIGGGGGNGGNAAGIFVAAGGSGGNGGSANQITIQLNTANGQGGGVTTLGDFAAGVLAQSIGGGGGNGGYAKAAGLFIAAGVGGSGGSGGNGYSGSGSSATTTSFTSNAPVSTFGDQSHGVLLQSIGGGGGNGGAATVLSIGASFATGIAVGGSGGSGGGGGGINATNQGSITTAGADSMGLIAQSIGGGGGNGGAATAKTWAIATLPEIPTISFSTTVGGSGGSGGYGGTVNVTNTAGGSISTAGDGAHGILAQSIGGGGGNGGDSTATSLAFEGESPTVKLGVSIGGSGTAAGSGGAVTVTNGPTPGCSGTCGGSITTVGRNAAGIVAQSIGGGGGNGGAGNASTSSQNLGGNTGFAVGMTYAMGGKGAAAGDGGAVTVTNGYGSSIITGGSGAQGILAQSIGGGGGNGGGGSAGGSGDNVDINVSVGGSGAAGGYGYNAIVYNYAKITTAGGDAVGILAQSIGGGGGTAGSSDAAASIGKAGQVEDNLNPPSNSYSANVAVGASGGLGGTADLAQVTNAGTLTTTGIRAYGIMAQSIGAGGGSGGAATSAANSVLGGTTTDEKGEGKSGTYAATVAVGGGGGAAGNGGNVWLNNTGSILTAGYSAHGMLAQSIGGGGGVGAEGTANNTTTIGLGVGYSGVGAASGNGGPISIGNTSVLLATLGDDAYGILGQSIGGGGGMGSAGCSNSSSASVQGISATRCFGNSNTGVSGNAAPWNDSSSFTLIVGGGPSAAGNGGSVSITENGPITTTGARAFGIVAQSIGGGGGLAAASAVNIASTPLQGSPGQNIGKGGDVSVTLNGSITTSGAGAWGILAQSIGGGGGFIGDASLPLQFPVSNTLPDLPFSLSNSAFSPDSGTVKVNVGGNITTTGANAHGVVAQAVGGGGGIAAGCCNSATATLVAGNSAQIYNLGGEFFAGQGMAVTVNQTGGTISTSGPGSIGIVAQSTGKLDVRQPISVTISGTVTGGTNAGAGGAGAAGILLSGGGNTASNVNTITVNQGGKVGTQDGVAGTAITTDYGLTNVSNAGTITGSISLGSTPGTIGNSGTINAGATLTTSTLTNSGVLNIGTQGLRPLQTTHLAGALSQTGTGALGVTIDSGNQANSLLQVDNAATIAGQVVPTAITLLPGAVTVVTAGTLTWTGQVQSSLLFTWSAAASATSLAITPAANFTPGGVSLTQSETSLANFLTTAWNNGDAGLASQFGYLSQVSSGATYTAALDSVSAKATQAQITAMANSTGTMLGAAMSCPVFVGQGTLLGEDNCVWAKFTGQQSNSWSGGDTPGYQVASTSYRLGGQHEIAPGWFLGGALAAGRTWADANGGSSGHGTTFDGSIALKHTMGPWLFAGSIAVGSGAFHSDRLINLPAVGTLPAVAGALTSDPNLFIAGSRLRAAYDFAFDGWYVRPYGDLDVIYTHSGRFQESGMAGYALDVRASSKTSVVVSPMVEIGGRLLTPDGSTLRPYAAFGVSFLPNSTRSVDASFIGALPSDGTFRTFMKSPNILGNVALGVQIYRAGGFEVKAEYDVKVGGSYLSQSGGARVAYHF